MMFLTYLLPHFERLERLYINISSDLAPLCLKNWCVTRANDTGVAPAIFKTVGGDVFSVADYN